MGSGKGQSRRAQVVIKQEDLQDDGQPTPGSIVRAALPLIFGGKKWQGFIDDNNLRNVSTTRYYLGAAPGRLMMHDREKVINELFKDAIAVGAIVLPPNYLS